MGCSSCGSRKLNDGSVTKYEVKTNDGRTTQVDDMAAVRRVLTLGGGGTYRKVLVK